MKARSFSAPWGRRIWLVTGLVSLLSLGVSLSIVIGASARKPADRKARWIAPIVILVAIGGTAFWCIRSFVITDDAIVIQRSFWKNRILLGDITSAEFDPKACHGAFKTIGNDGLFAMHGRFRSKRLGKFQAYDTDPENAVVLKTTSDTIVLSPERPRNFLTELNRRRRNLQEHR